MVIDYKQLEGWLHQKLQPLCVADPVPLSQYVIALIKKDKPETELREICVDQLEVFLQDNTANFVSDLFATLNSRSYITSSGTINESQSKPSADFRNTKSDKKRHTHSDSSWASEPTDAKERRGRSASGKPKSLTHSKSRSRSPQPHIRSTLSSASGPQRAGHKGADRELSNEIGPKNRGDRSDDYVVTRRGNRDGSSDRRYKQREHELETRRDRSVRERIRSPERDRHEFRGRGQPDRRSSNGTRRRCRDFDERGFCAFGSQCLFDHGPDAIALPAAQAAAVSVITQMSSLPYSSTNVSGTVSILPQPGRIPSIVSAVTPDTSNAQQLDVTTPVYRPTPITGPTSEPYGSDRSDDAGLARCLVQAPDEPALVNRSFRGPSGSNSIRRNVVPIPMVSIPNSIGVNTFRTPLAYEPDKPQISVLATSEATSSNGDLSWPNSTNVSEPHLTYTPSPIIDRSVNTAPGLPTTESSFPCELYVTRIPWRLNNDIKLAEHFSKFGTLVRIVSRYMGLPDAALVEYSSPDEAEKTFRSPEPILANRFIRLSTSLQSKPVRFRRGRQTPYDLRPRSLMQRLGRKPVTETHNYAWLRSAVDETYNSPMDQYNFQSRIDSARSKVSGSRWRLERNTSGGYPNADSGDDDADGDIDRSHDDREIDECRNKSDVTEKEGYGRKNEIALKTSLPNSHFKFSISYKDKQETAAYIWQKQKNLALKQREEQLKLLDKSKEAKQAILEAQTQRIVRLKGQLKKVMSQLELLQKTDAVDSSQTEGDRKSTDRVQLLSEAKRLQQELEAALAAEKKCLSSKLVSSTDVASIGSTATSAVALQALPEPLATERRKQIAEVRALLKQVEDDMAILKAKGEPVTEQFRRVLELKRRLVQLETIRPSDFADAFNGDASAHSELSGSFPSRAQTKLDKRPRTLFISGLGQSDVTYFQRALAMNYLHTQRIVKHNDPVTNHPVLEVTFCTRDFAEAAVRQFQHFHGNALTMSFEPPPLVDSVPPTETAHSSVVSSTQSELPMESDYVESSTRVTSYSTHSSPTSTTVPTTE